MGGVVLDIVSISETVIWLDLCDPKAGLQQGGQRHWMVVLPKEKLAPTGKGSAEGYRSELALVQLQKVGLGNPGQHLPRNPARQMMEVGHDGKSSPNPFQVLSNLEVELARRQKFPRGLQGEQFGVRIVRGDAPAWHDRAQ